MADIIFVPYTGWTDITDPANIPADARTITAADLLRYENFGKDAAAAINANTSALAALPDQYAAKSVETSKADATDLTSHTSNTANPHAVTKAQVGLSNVDNTADTAKPVSTAQQAALDKLARGCVYKATSAVTIPGLSALQVLKVVPSFTFKAGRNYRIVWDTDWIADTAGSAVTFILATSPTTDPDNQTTGITTIQTRNSQSGLAAVSSSVRVTGYLDAPAADSTVKLKFLARLDSAGTTFQIQGNRAGGAIQYRIYDDGAQI